jgi:hypothetical protein
MEALRSGVAQGFGRFALARGGPGRDVHELHVVDAVQGDALQLLEHGAVAAGVPEELEDVRGFEEGFEGCLLALICRGD